MDFLIVGLSGFFGAILRYAFYLVERAYLGSQFPVATLIINVLGCLFSGIILGLQTNSTASSMHLMQLFSIGFIGSFTTFSALTAETAKLFETNFQLQAFGNVLLNLILGFSFFIIGKLAIR